MGFLTGTALVFLCIIMASFLVQSFVIHGHGHAHSHSHHHGLARSVPPHPSSMRSVRNTHCSHHCDWTSCKSGIMTQEAHGCGSGTHLCGSRECDGGFEYQCCKKK